MIYTVNSDLLINKFTDVPLKDAINFLNSSTICGLDTETSGLNPRLNYLRMIQFGNYETQYVIFFQNLSVFGKKLLLEAIADYKGRFVIQNVKFDAQFLLKRKCQLNRVADTMLREKVIHTGKLNHSASYAALVKRHLNIDLPKDEQKKFGDKNWVVTESAIEYAANDVKYIIPVYAKQEYMLKKYGLIKLAKLESACSLVFAAIEFEGMLLDKEKWTNLYLSKKKETREIDIKISDILYSDSKFEGLFPKGFQGDLFLTEEEIKKVPINIGSSKQLLPILQRIDPGATDTAAQTIETMAHKHPVVKEISNFKKAKKLSTTYGEDFLDLVENGKIHTSISQILNTGRISSSQPNMQQLPSYSIDVAGINIYPYRDAFYAPDGWVFVSSDFVSQELCVIAVYSKDPVWLKALQNGEDLHSTCAAIVYGKEWDDAAEPDCVFQVKKKKCKCVAHQVLRHNVKSINFGLAYGMGPQKLALKLGITEEESTDLIHTYFKAFPSIKSFLDSLGRFGKKNGYIKTFPPFSRVRWFEGWYKGMGDMKILGSIERQAKNTPIQGTSADMMKLAMVLVHRYILKHKLPVKVVMTVHDQLDTICIKEYALMWKATLTRLMENAAVYILSTDLLKAETTITKNWSK